MEMTAQAVLKVIGGDLIEVNHYIVRNSPFLSSIVDFSDEDESPVIDMSDRISKETIMKMNEFYEMQTGRPFLETERIMSEIYKMYPHTKPVRIEKEEKVNYIETPMTIHTPEDVLTKHILYIWSSNIMNIICPMKLYEKTDDIIITFIKLTKILTEQSFIGGCDEFRGILLYNIMKIMDDAKTQEETYKQIISYMKTELSDGDVAEIIDTQRFANVEKIANDIYGRYGIDYEFSDDHTFDETNGERVKKTNYSVKHRFIKKYGYDEYIVYKIVAYGSVEELKYAHNEDVNINYIFQEILVAIINGNERVMNYLLDRLTYVKHENVKVEYNIDVCQNNGRLSSNTYVNNDSNAIMNDVIDTNYKDNDESDGHTINCYYMFTENVTRERGRITKDECSEVCNKIIINSNSFGLMMKYNKFAESKGYERFLTRAICGNRYRIISSVFESEENIKPEDYTYALAKSNNERTFGLLYNYIVNNRTACSYIVWATIVCASYDLFVKVMETDIWKGVTGFNGSEIYDSIGSSFDMAFKTKSISESDKLTLERMKKYFEGRKEFMMTFVR